MGTTQNISVGLQAKNGVGPSGPTAPAGLANIAHNLLINPDEVETFTPIGQEKTHIGFVIRGTFINKHNETIDIPEMAFRIRKANPLGDGSSKELRVALLALNSFVVMHQHLTSGKFKEHMDKMDGQTIHFFGEEDVPAILDDRSWLEKRRSTKIVDRMRFLVPNTLDFGRRHYMNAHADKRFVNEHPIYEFNAEGVDKLADALFRRSKPLQEESDEENFKAKFEQVPPRTEVPQDYIEVIGEGLKAQADKVEIVAEAAKAGSNITKECFPSLTDIDLPEDELVEYLKGIGNRTDSDSHQHVLRARL